MKRIVPGGPVEAEITVDRSRFIASAAPAFDVETARDFIQQVRSKYPDATHHVPVFIVGHGAGVTMHCGDDGEPSGTAGRPALAVLQGSGLGDVVVVITRYFGGRKLGTGGLVRAYSDAVRAVLAVMPRAEKVATTTIMTVVAYPLYERARLLVQEYHGLVIDEDFAADVTISARFRDESVEDFTNRIIDLSSGSGKVIIVDKESNTLMPLDSEAGTS